MVLNQVVYLRVAPIVVFGGQLWKIGKAVTFPKCDVATEVVVVRVRSFVASQNVVLLALSLFSAPTSLYILFPNTKKWIKQIFSFHY